MLLDPYVFTYFGEFSRSVELEISLHLFSALFVASVNQLLSDCV